MLTDENKFLRLSTFNLKIKNFKELPCDLNPTQCKNEGECVNDNKGGYTCKCKTGYADVNCTLGN
jgi:hypothetical protein